jgi:Arc/MetJ family transcription regulator
MSRTNVVLDDELVSKCQTLTGIKTRRAVIDCALNELLRRKRQREVLQLRGAVKWEGDLDAWRRQRV